MANIQKGSILFNNLRQIVGRKSKSTFVYETDKTFAQRWIAKQTLKIKEQQKFHAVGLNFHIFSFDFFLN
jgi:hypothetical protein